MQVQVTLTVEVDEKQYPKHNRGYVATPDAIADSIISRADIGPDYSITGYSAVEIKRKR